MAIPHEDRIVFELLRFLSRSETGTMHCNRIYAELAELFPELTKDELQRSYRNSKSKWANSVQFARLRCVQRGYILRPSHEHSYGRGYWTITEKGRAFIERLRLNQPAVEEERTNLENMVNGDLETIRLEEEYFEGKAKERYTTYYERNPQLRAQTILIHGTQCKVCGFEFEKLYGRHGAGFIEVHHLRPVSSLGEETKVDPITDLTVVCSNCHRMIHRRKDQVLSIDELRELIKSNLNVL